MKNGSIHGMSPAALQGRAKGALFFIGFGCVWTYLGLQATHYASAVSFAALGLAVVALLAGSIALMRRAGAVPEGHEHTDAAIRARRMFLAVNIIQWVSIITAISILVLLHMPEYITTAIAIIVALHLFPLAESFHNRMHYVTGTLVLAWSLGVLMWLPKERVTGCTALGVGVILLISAASNLMKGLGAPRPKANTLQAEHTA